VRGERKGEAMVNGGGGEEEDRLIYIYIIAS
jgi:hypothetical protein